MSDPRPSWAGFLPAGAQEVNLLGVDYVHLKLEGRGDLYMTRHGLAFWRQLQPENWYARDWFERNREKLAGSSTVYRVPTRTVNGNALSLVVKWCRVGEEIPFDTFTLNRFVEAEFNSPHEEFALVMEMREREAPIRVRTHRPLAIFVPNQRLQLWQTGRSTSRIARKTARFRDVELDICRQYILIYEWIKGVSLPEAMQGSTLEPNEQRQVISTAIQRATDELAARGFRVLDMKPEHIIVRPRPDGRLLHDRTGQPAYALVDFELIERTDSHERAVTAARRAEYLHRQRDRFRAALDRVFPPHLNPVNLLGLDYVHGPCVSTQGALWVVGRDPMLFDYFQPERWRHTPRTRLSADNQVYRTRTKDHIQLVWKVSRIGERPEPASDKPQAESMIAHGYNSPFEEFAWSMRLARAGVPTVYPRAIYRTGRGSDGNQPPDQRRYASHHNLQATDGQPILRPDHLYITVWGYWNGQDELLAAQDGIYSEPLNLDQALDCGLISENERRDLQEGHRLRLAAVGFEDLNPKPDHLLLSLLPNGSLMVGPDGRPEVRICNFEFIRPMKHIRPPLESS